jgi:signal transduction histidine kinase
MPISASLAQAVLEALGFVLFTRQESGALRLSGPLPAWLAALWPELENNEHLLPLAEASPFLENFLIDAEECWKKNGADRAKSGPWIEQNDDGVEVQLEATAMTAAGQPILLIERLGEAFEANKTVLQRARETVIAHQRLNSEIQKKEILLHCVADDMTAALANVITSLRLIELEDNGPRTKLLLGLASRATQEQQTLIHRILGVFEEELRAVYGAGGETEADTDWRVVLRQALDSISPLFEEKGVRLDAPVPAASIMVRIDPTQLGRVVVNLLENALERSASGATVIVRAEEEAEALLVSFQDNGLAMAPEVCEDLFGKWDLGTAAPTSALRIHFCRIVIENAGGEIGCTSLPESGHRFWIRLPKDGVMA